MVTMTSKKGKNLCIGPVIRPQTALIGLRFVQTAEDNSDKWSWRAPTPAKDIYRHFVTHF
jgi:hypothetical protein